MTALADRNRARATHGHKRKGVTSTEYNIWNGLRQRCLNQNGKQYPSYGGRGIVVCERWESFENFLADMGERPSRRSLDRIDNDGPYSPENCRWATRQEQARNRRNNVRVKFNGVEITMQEAIDRSGLNRATVWYRIYNGWSVPDALSVRPRTEIGPFKPATWEITP